MRNTVPYMVGRTLLVDMFRPRFVVVWKFKKDSVETRTLCTTMEAVWECLRILELNNGQDLTYRLENYDHARHERSHVFY